MFVKIMSIVIFALLVITSCLIAYAASLTSRGIDRKKFVPIFLSEFGFDIGIMILFYSLLFLWE